MATIIAARFDTWEKAEDAVQALINLDSLGRDNVCTFYVGPPGQHAALPLGGDHDKDQNATEAHTESMKAGAVGAGIGGFAALPGGPLAAAAGAAVGAYAGSLVGALSGMNESSPEDQPEQMVRQAGVMVAAKMDDTAHENSVIRTLHQHGATEIEQTVGQWRDGTWADFDPASPPYFVDI